MNDYTEPHWDAAALVVVDLQRDFLDDGVAPVPGTSSVVPNVIELTRAFRSAGLPIVHVVRFYEPGGSDVDLPRRRAVEEGARIVVPGSIGADPADGVLPRAVCLDSALLTGGRLQHVGNREVILFKPRWSAFHRTQLEQWLHEQGCDTVLVAGCNLPNCPRATLFDASERDFRTALATDAVSQTSDERLADLDRIGVRLCSTANVVAALAGVNSR